MTGAVRSRGGATASLAGVTGGSRDQSTLTAILLGLSILAAGAVFWPGLEDMVAFWSREEYSHGYVVPLIGMFLLAQRLPAAAKAADGGRMLGVIVALLAVSLGLIGRLSGIADLVQYGFLAVVAALVITTFGFRPALALWAPLVYLVFMVPLPQILYLKLSTGMQLLSSELGVQLIRSMQVPVFLEGNVIDLGTYKLQVAEACSGLRYLFPLMSFGFLFAVIYRGPTWHKLTLFLSTIPITILMNSIRIGVTGVLVHRYGIAQAEGFLHFFEGWVIFIACVLLLFAEALVLMRLVGLRQPLADMVDLRLPQAQHLNQAFRAHARSVPALATAAVLLAAVGIVHSVGVHNVVSSSRQDLAAFPALLGSWQGRAMPLDPVVLKVLAADDTLLSNYDTSNRANPVNLFIAYYETQTDGRAIHSPEVCIPGDGWEIARFERVVVTPEGRAGQAMQVNRAIIQKGLDRQLVYYWFEGRGRQQANEYLVKWYVLWDGLTRGRTDGGLVRLVTPIRGAEGEALADARLRTFLDAMLRELPRFIPS